MKKFKIGYRTAKTALGTTLAIFIAQFFGLEFYVSAGIIAILCIQNTKKKSLHSASSRFAACILSLVFAFLFFETIGYHPVAIGLLLLFFIPVTVMLKITEGIATSSVILLHVYSVKDYTFSLVLNELGIITIGIGIALIMNIYMPSVEKELKTYQLEIESNFQQILLQLAQFLRQGDTAWDGKELTETASILHKAKSLAFRDVENHLRRNENSFYHYFKMRERQLDVMERMVPIVASIEMNVEQAAIVAEFLEQLAESVHPGNTAIVHLNNLSEMTEIFQGMPLPETRIEFEARASLRHLVKELEQYLIIKCDFKGGLKQYNA
ncbi:aromatic acid exporter family protein [Bacillus sp. FJAT-45066]|uniref:aromatic acid exporter family protein n=1 Tax=Bacillus sp. FJAT-45066 TaxID=2011010 RepID=UPI000BB8164F|nr:aromatic acid exporter family protein [Bacillus sp. FJAT-45066]